MKDLLLCVIYKSSLKYTFHNFDPLNTPQLDSIHPTTRQRGAAWRVKIKPGKIHNVCVNYWKMTNRKQLPRSQQCYTNRVIIFFWLGIFNWFTIQSTNLWWAPQLFYVDTRNEANFIIWVWQQTSSSRCSCCMRGLPIRSCISSPGRSRWHIAGEVRVFAVNKKW